jgi:ribonuclease HI
VIEVFCDGAVRTDGKDRVGASACAFAIFVNEKFVYSAYRLLGDVTSNQAEYEAVIFALTTCVAMDYKTPVIYTDSAAVFNQITRNWACKSKNLVPLLYTVKKIQQNFAFTIKQVPRKFVHIPDAMCNELLDEFQGITSGEYLDV